MDLSSIKRKVAEFPQNPGVYFFRDRKGKILYIGKATNLRSRVGSYLRGTETRVHIESMMPLVAGVDFQETDSVLEALVLESNLVKKHQPKYNVQLKDDKSFAYFAITKEEFPKVLIVRKTDLLKISNFKPASSADGFQIKNEFQIPDDKLLTKNFKYKDVLIDRYYGPYTSKKQMEIALKIVRKIFPFHALRQQSEKGCLDFQIGMCPGPHAGAITKGDYLKNIRGIRLILEGKKKRLVTTMEREMENLAKKEEFEKAAEIRNKIFALQHIRDVALITGDLEEKIKNETSGDENIRVEAYDISNISGQHAVGSMVVFENGEPAKNEYRKFKIKTVEGSDDVGMMREVLTRRFKNDWAMPDLVLLDGGQGHVNMGEKLLKEELGLALAIAGVAKGPTRKKLDVRLVNEKYLTMEARKLLQNERFLKRIMDEAHRFAITYHRKVRRKSFVV